MEGESRGQRFASGSLWSVVVMATVGVAFVCDSGRDGMRLPKEALLNSAGILLAAGFLMALVLGVMPEVRPVSRPAIVLAGACVLWTLITTLASTQRSLSLETLLWVGASASFFVATLILIRGRGLATLGFAIVPAVGNAAFAILQRSGLVTPFHAKVMAHLPPRFRATALIGNPDDVGAYLVVPAIAALVLTTTCRGRNRAMWAAATAILVAGIAFAETLGGLIAFGCAAAVLIALRGRRAAMIIGGGLLTVAAGAVVLALLIARRAAFIAGGGRAPSGHGGGLLMHLPLMRRFALITWQIRHGLFSAALSYRNIGFETAWRMFLDHPLKGMGPGCYGFWFTPYKLLLVQKHPEFLRFKENFHEAHSDHLQLLATTGLIGWMLLAGAILLLASVWFRPENETDPRATFARRFGPSAAVGICVLALGAFPFELAAPLTMCLFLSAAAMAWSET